MARISTTKTHNSGIALGGIGSGSIELLPDGEFHFWQIANPPRITKRCNEEKLDDGEGSAGALSFWVREKKADFSPVVRKLGMKTDPEDFSYRMFAWNKPVERIDFNGNFPVCDLNYIDRELSCNISMRAASPFVPHNSDISSTPGFYIDFIVENTTEDTVDISLLGALEPNFFNKREGNCNTGFSTEGGYGVFIGSEKATASPSCGNVCLSVSGDGEKSYITAEFFRFMKEYIAESEFGVTQESFLFGFRESGCLPDSMVGCIPRAIPKNLNILKENKLDSLLEEYLEYPFAASLFDRIKYCIPGFPKNRTEKITFLRSCRKQLKRMGNSFGSCALCSKINLVPGEKKNVRFIFTWYFPNQYSENGKKLGHYYENLYKNSLEANNFLAENSDRVYNKATEFSEILNSSDLPSVYSDCWSSNLSQLVKCSVYLKNGKFGLWEGLGFCGLHTTDITYHASFGLINIFPDLQKRQMLMGAEFQKKDGRVHHLFKPGFEDVDRGFNRVDMNMQFVLMVLRDYMFTGDKEYLLSLWDNVRRAMDYTEKLDRDNDGLPDYKTKRNTYDAWNFSGASAYISILWLAALKAGVIIADKVNDTVYADKWKLLLEKGKESLENKLWNGGYYNLWINGKNKDESLMTDQLDGEWFLRMIGIGGNISDDRVRQIVNTIFINNFDSDQGLVNATFSENKKTAVHTYKNCQTLAVWTGVNYAFSALALSVGLKEISDIIVSSIHNNQYRLGHFWDHWECGHHYTRPMSSWTTLIAASGLCVDCENRIITFRPVCRNITFPLVLPDLIARVKISDEKLNVDCIDGDIDSWKISVIK